MRKLILLRNLYILSGKELTMSSRWKNILLISSLVFNLTIVGIFGFNYFKSDCKTYYKPKTEQGELIIKRRRDEIRNLRKDMMETRRGFFELLKAGASDEVLNRQVELIIQKQILMEKEIANHLIELRKNMTNEEANRFFERETAKRNNRDHRKKRR